MRFLDWLKERRRAHCAPLVESGADRFLNTLPDAAYDVVRQRLAVNAGFFTDAPYLRQQSRADWQQTDPQIQKFAARLVETFRKQSIPLYVHTAFRTRDEQHALFRKGRTKAIWPRAPHCQGKAVDIVHGVHHWELTRQEWAIIGKAGKEIAHRMGLKLVWGGDWGFYDPAHWELQNWRDEVLYTEPQEAVRRSARYILRHL